MLAGRAEGITMSLQPGSGILTPFCSCLAVLLFIGFVSAGVPLGVTFSFLIAAPMVNEVALGSLVCARRLEGSADAWPRVWAVCCDHRRLRHWAPKLRGAGGWSPGFATFVLAVAVELPDERIKEVDRIKSGIEAVSDIVGRVWMWIIAGIAVGAFIHGYVPARILMVRIMGLQMWWSVLAAVLLGILMYTNAAGIIPIVEALLGKGAALGTTLAFMMSVIALSLPEMIILRKVLSVKLIAVFVAVVGTGILAVGFLFNALFH